MSGAEGDPFPTGSVHAGWRVVGPGRPESGAVRTWPVQLVVQAAGQDEGHPAEEAGQTGQLQWLAWTGSTARLQREQLRRAGAALEAAPGSFVPLALLEREDGLVVIGPRPPAPLEQTLPTSEVLELLREAALALRPLHERGLAHGELDPACLVRTLEGLRLLPPGVRPVAPDLIGLGLAIDPIYAAPEVLDGRPASPASDVFSLGLILVRLSTGQPPVSAPDPAGAYLMRITAPLPDLTALRPGIDPRLPALLRHLCAPLGQRPADAAALLDTLARAEQHPLPPPEPAPVRLRDPRSGLAIIAACLAAGALIVGATAAAVLSTPTSLDGVTLEPP